MTLADKVFKEMETDSRRLQGQEEKEGYSDLKGTECQLQSLFDVWCG